MVIGHEIFHGFDNSGRRFNGTGAFVDWCGVWSGVALSAVCRWTNSSKAEFMRRSQCLVHQSVAALNPMPIASLNVHTALNGWLAGRYDSFPILPGLYVNGTNTLGENIADAGD